MKNDLNKNVIEDFGNEWQTYNQSELEKEEQIRLFNNYFDIFPFHLIGKDSVGFDMGCGSGRWAMIVAPKVKKLNCVEPSKLALKEAKLNLKNHKNCFFHNDDVMRNAISNNSQDFGYSLGVLHHIPNTSLALQNCLNKLKKGAPFLIYLYYRFDNKPIWFVIIWRISNVTLEHTPS